MRMLQNDCRLKRDSLSSELVGPLSSGTLWIAVGNAAWTEHVEIMASKYDALPLSKFLQMGTQIRDMHQLFFF